MLASVAPDKSTLGPALDAYLDALAAALELPSRRYGTART